MELEIDNLSCRRGGRLVFSGLSATLSTGTPMVLRGPNGSGKSTLLRVLAGLLPPSGGEIRLGSLTLSERSAWQEKVAYAGHLDAVKPALAVAENLALWGRMFGVGADGIASALTRFGLAHIADRPAAQCSAGQKRRLGLARLMVVDKPVWLLDEPTVSLDTDATAEVAALIREHVSTGGIALVATHIELALGDAPVLQMPEPGTRPAASADDDAFLAGEWA
ncbi:MAG: heme ABC exporter ATP-binding protein CcmA [Pseudomonadota bacterium]